MGKGRTKEGRETMKRSFVRYLVMSSALGLSVAIGLLLLLDIVDSHPLLARKLGASLVDLSIVLWPTSIWLLATSGGERTLAGYTIVFLSIMANGMLYAVLGSLAWCLRYFLTRRSV